MNKQLEETACLYVLDQLDRGERAAFETRLVRDPELAAFVKNLEPAISEGVHSLPAHEPPAGMLGRIEARIDAQEAQPAHRPRRKSESTRWFAAPLDWFSIARWGVTAVIAVSLATLAIQSLRTPAPAQPKIVFVGLDANRNTFAELPMHDRANDADARFIELASLAENYWRKPGNLPIKASPDDNRAYALFDPGSRQGFIGVEQLPAIDKNQRYHLWLVDPDTNQVHDAGGLPLDGLNRGLYSFALGPDDSPKSGRPHFFITLEEDGTGTAPTKPSGKVVLGRNDI